MHNYIKKEDFMFYSFDDYLLTNGIQEGARVKIFRRNVNVEHINYAFKNQNLVSSIQT